MGKENKVAIYVVDKEEDGISIGKVNIPEQLEEYVVGIAEVASEEEKCLRVVVGPLRSPEVEGRLR